MKMAVSSRLSITAVLGRSECAGRKEEREREQTVLEGVLLARLDAVEVSPRETVAGDEAGENVVAAEYADDCTAETESATARRSCPALRTSKRKQRQSDPIRQEGLVVDELARVSELERLSRDVADQSADDAAHEDLVDPGRDDPVLQGLVD